MAVVLDFRKSDDPVKERRIGRYRMSINFISTRRKETRAVNSSMLIIQAIPEKNSQDEITGVIFTAFSSLFQKTPSPEIPLYEIRVSNRGQVAAVKQELNDAPKT